MGLRVEGQEHDFLLMAARLVGMRSMVGIAVIFGTGAGMVAVDGDLGSRWGVW